MPVTLLRHTARNVSPVLSTGYAIRLGHLGRSVLFVHSLFANRRHLSRCRSSNTYLSHPTFNHNLRRAFPHSLRHVRAPERSECVALTSIKHCLIICSPRRTEIFGDLYTREYNVAVKEDTIEPIGGSRRYFPPI